jgi:hypothetical protein
MKAKFMTIIDTKPSTVSFKTNKEELVGFVSGKGKIKSPTLGKIKFDFINDLGNNTAYIGVTLFHDSMSPVIYDFELTLLDSIDKIHFDVVGGHTWGNVMHGVRFDFQEPTNDDYNRIVQTLMKYIIKELKA